MRISARGRYALRAMADLALYASERPVSRHELAERQGISANYVAQLFRRLRRAQLVQAIKGPGGGYILARDAACISAGDVLRAVEGPLAVAECVMPTRRGPQCQRQPDCLVWPLLQCLSQVITETLDRVTLQDLCARRLTLSKEEKINGSD